MANASLPRPSPTACDGQLELELMMVLVPELVLFRKLSRFALADCPLAPSPPSLLVTASLAPIAPIVLATKLRS